METHGTRERAGRRGTARRRARARAHCPESHSQSASEGNLRSQSTVHCLLRRHPPPGGPTAPHGTRRDLVPPLGPSFPSRVGLPKNPTVPFTISYKRLDTRSRATGSQSSGGATGVGKTLRTRVLRKGSEG